MKNEKLTYVAPEAEIEVIDQEDVVLISTIDGENNLDESYVQFGNW